MLVSSRGRDWPVVGRGVVVVVVVVGGGGGGGGGGRRGGGAFVGLVFESVDTLGSDLRVGLLLDWAVFGQQMCWVMGCLGLMSLYDGW